MNSSGNGLNRNQTLAAGGGMLGAGLGNLFSNFNNPSDSAMPYMNQMPGVISKYLDPYINAGNRALPGLENQYGSLMNNPGGRVNEIGASYHESPGFQFALQQGLQGANHAAAAGGMAGSPQHEQQNMGMATNFANQDYNQWLQHALGMYGAGLQGNQGLYNTGAESGMGAAGGMASILANQAKLAYEGQNAENQRSEGGWGSFLGGLGTLGGAIFGGPWGAVAGGAVGNSVGGG